jgi:hypothetical protein
MLIFNLELTTDLALRTINLGDSGFLLCRPQSSPESEKDEDKPFKWQVVYEAPHQSHYFNCPFQLGFNNGDLVYTTAAYVLGVVFYYVRP